MATAPLRPDEVLLCSYFTGNGESGLQLAASEDGYTFRAMNAGKSIWTGAVGDGKLVRDPSVHLGPDGTFHVVWSTGEREAHFGYCRSRDLKTWTPQKLIRPWRGTGIAPTCSAPKIVVEPVLGHFVLYWSSALDNRTAASAYYVGDSRILCTLTTDFETFEPARPLFDPGFSVTDATIVRDVVKGRWVMFVKDDRTAPQPRKNIFLAASENLEGPYAKVREPFTGDAWAAGPAAIRVGDRWFCYFDRYAQKSYALMTSPDLTNWRDETPAMSLPIGARHFTVIKTPRAIVEAIG